jgi:myo-inositol 2-dehydrogenase/D-chiro-inositol 1-dehydrogenase
LSRSETGAIIIPAMPLRLHPGVAAIRQALASSELGAFRGLRIEAQSAGEKVDLARVMVPRVVDVVRALLGEIEALTATGDPPGEHPDLELIVQLRAAEARRAELRLSAGPDEPFRLSLMGADGSMTLEFDSQFDRPARLIRRDSGQDPEVHELESWDSHEAIFSVLMQSCARRESSELPHPNLLDATRTMEVAEATARSLRRGRTVDLHYEEVSEEATFKSVMTSTGCVVLLIALFILPIALGGPALGVDWTIYIAYLIPPALVIFVLLQAFKLAVRRPGRSEAGTGDNVRATRSARRE